MTETPESSPQPTTVARQPPHDDRYGRASRLGQVLAWVGIIAGIVFIVAVIFFSGFALGSSSSGHYGGHDGWHRGYYGAPMGPGGSTGSCPMMGTGGQTGPGGMMGPGGPTTSPVPTTPRP